jgi:DNA-binding CsgD family transcriptional regulator
MNMMRDVGLLPGPWFNALGGGAWRLTMERNGALHGLGYLGVSEKRTGPGVLILSGSSSSKFMNRRGWQLIQEINQAQSVERGALFPRPIMEIYSEIQKLSAEEKVNDWEQVEIRRLAGKAKRRILLRGFVFPGQQHEKTLLVVILMERVRYREMNLDGADGLGLTEREHQVVRNLVKGWTNKEIASDLGITEQTVKAHIRQVMTKMGTTTRTGILSKLLLAKVENAAIPTVQRRLAERKTPDVLSYHQGRSLNDVSPSSLS